MISGPAVMQIRDVHQPGVYGPICHEFGIRGYGNSDYGVVLVGIAPGYDEAMKTKRPFTGPSGQFLDKMLRFVGWSRDKIYATNVVCWWNDSPSVLEIDACSIRLRHEIDNIHPKLIITAGAIANEAIMGTKRHKGSRGAVVWSDYWNAYVLDTHHPAYALKAKSMSVAQDIIRDLSKIEQVLHWRPNGLDARVTHRVVQTLAEAQRVLDTLPTNTPVTLDIETANPDIELMDAYSDTLLCFSVAYRSDSRERVFTFPTKLFPECVRSGAHLRAHRLAGECPACSLPMHPLTWPIENIRWTFQAGQYDIPGIAQRFGVTLPLCDDTMLMSHCTDERPGYHGLKQNAREWLGGVGWYEEQVKPFYKGNLGKLPADVIEAYNAKDAAYTLRLMPIFTRKMEADDTTGLYRNLLMPAMQTFIDMQMRGINVDQDKLKHLAYDFWFPRYLEMHRELQLDAQREGWLDDQINLNSTQQLGKLFFGALSVPVRKWTPAGKPSLDKEVLDSIDHPFAAKIRAYRMLDGMIEYVFSITNNLKYDGLLHPSAYVTTTRTGRTSYRDPAMQTIPKDYTVGADYARLREIIIPHDPATHELIEADYNQIEVWMAWALSHDPVLLSHLQSGDVHSYTAEGAFNTKREDHTAERWAELRQNAKKIRFGIQYGEGAKKLSSPPPVGIGSTFAEAQRYIDNYRRTYPVYTQWMREIQQTALKQGYLRTPSGRVMRFPCVLDHKELRQALNFPVQSVATDYNLLSMIELHTRLREFNSWIILNIHDNLTIENDRRYRSQVIALVREVMEQPKFAGYPSVPVDIKVGDNLGQMEKVK